MSTPNDPRGSSPSHPSLPVVSMYPTETTRTSIFLPPLLPGFDPAATGPSALNAAPTAGSLARAFQRRWLLAISSGLLAALLTGLLISVLFPARYTTYYRVKINSAKGGNLIGDRGEEADFNVFKATQAALAKTRPVILRALDQQSQGRFVRDLGIVRNQSDPVEWLQTSVKTDFLQAPEIMTATLSADNAEELTLLLNSMAKSLIQENQIIEDARHLAQIEQMQRTADNFRNDIDLKRKIYNQRLSTLGPNQAVAGRKLEQLEQDLRDTRKSLRDKQSELAGVRVRLEQLNQRASNPEANPVPEQALNEILRQEPEAAEYAKRVQVAKKHYQDALRIIQNPGSDQMRSYQNEVDAAERSFEAFRRSKLPDLTKKYREKLAIDSSVEATRLRDDVLSLEQQEALLRDAADRIETQIHQFRPQNMPVELVGLQQEIDSKEDALKRVIAEIQFKQVNVPPARVSILQDAIEPHGRDYSRQLKFVGAGSIGMFLIAVLGVSFVEFRSRKITSSDEVKSGLGLHVVGTVPALPEKARSPMAQAKLDAYWQNQLMESVDTIRTILLHSARTTNTRVIMVTSAVGGEGKTSLASQLAASLARAWKKTLLIDGDLRNPTSHKVFDIPQEPGLSEVLRGEMSAAEAVRSTPLSRLWILPAGHWDSHAVQALAQDNVRLMLEEMKQQYDFIILDSCPILPVADSLLLGQNVDGVLMTVMQDVSRSPAVHAAHQRLESLGIKTLGAVVIGAKNELGPLGYKYAYQRRP